MVLQIYLDPCTVNSRKVLAGLDFLGVPFEFNHIDYFTGQQKTPDFVKINPFATVPAAKDGDLVITESNAILQYAADLAANDAAYPKDLKKRANVNRWLLWEASSWFPSTYIYLVEYVVKPLLKAEPSEAIIEAESPRFNKLAFALDQTLSSSKWITGDHPTIADIAVAAPMHLWQDQRLPLGNYPNIVRWYKQVQELPSWQKTQEAVDKALLPDKKVASTQNGTHTNGALKSVRAKVNYTKYVGERLTELYFYEDLKAADIHEPGDDEKEITVTNGWDRRDFFHMDKEGFSLHDFKSAYTSGWEDEDTVKSKFYPEIVEFIKRTTGAQSVFVFDHTIRTAANQAKKLTQETNTSQRAPVMLVHCDYTAESGPLRVKQLLPDEADTLIKSRVAFLNVWKPLNVVEERPLAMCDVTSSPPEDFFKLHLRYRERNGENYVMRYNKDHQWYYFPKMMPEQVIILKTYDSETDGRARFVGHTAFEDPSSPEGAPMRESVEIRTIAFF